MLKVVSNGLLPDKIKYRKGVEDEVDSPVKLVCFQILEELVNR